MRQWILFLVCSATLAGCSIKIHDSGHDWDDDWDDDGWDEPSSQEERAADVCDPYCIELIDCGVLSDTAFVSCRDFCMERFSDNEAAVTAGCACIGAAQCQASPAERCEGDPLPGILSDAPSQSPTPGPGGTANGGDYAF